MEERKMARTALKVLLQSCQNEDFKRSLMNNMVLKKNVYIYIFSLDIYYEKICERLLFNAQQSLGGLIGAIH